MQTSRYCTRVYPDDSVVDTLKYTFTFTIPSTTGALSCHSNTSGTPPIASDRQARPFSPAVRAGDFIYVSGQVPADAEGEIVVGGIEAQTRQVMENLKAVLALAGATLDDVCKSTVLAAGRARLRRLQPRLHELLRRTARPARSTTEARLMVDAKVEIDVVAYKPKA